ncbi:MAG: SMC-Scp complex subunit ScpB [Pseudomonadota bacterium]
MAEPADELKPRLEALLFASERPLTVERLQRLLAEGDEGPDAAVLTATLRELQSDYADRGVELAELAGGWRFRTRETLGPWVSRLWEEKPPRYSRALLETLAIIAYRQPVTRGEVEDVRGVTVSTSIMKTLQEREWVRTVGHREVPGRPALYATTRAFLEHFNLNGLDDLPPLAELRSLDEVGADLDGGAAPGGDEFETEPEGPDDPTPVESA